MNTQCKEKASNHGVTISWFWETKKQGAVLWWLTNLWWGGFILYSDVPEELYLQVSLRDTLTYTLAQLCARSPPVWVSFVSGLSSWNIELLLWLSTSESRAVLPAGSTCLSYLLLAVYQKIWELSLLLVLSFPPAHPLKEKTEIFHS